MSEEHRISVEHQGEIARQLFPHAMDTATALKHTNELLKDTGLRLGHDHISHEEFTKHMAGLADAGHFSHEHVSAITQNITGIPTILKK